MWSATYRLLEFDQSVRIFIHTTNDFSYICCIRNVLFITYHLYLLTKSCCINVGVFTVSIYNTFYENWVSRKEQEHPTIKPIEYSKNCRNIKFKKKNKKIFVSSKFQTGSHASSLIQMCHYPFLINQI